MKRVQQRSIKHADCGVACVAMLAGCSYRRAFEAFGFAEDQSVFFTRHHHLIDALEKLGCAVKRKRFFSWREIRGRAIVAVNRSQNGYWHWVAFDGEAVLDPLPGKAGRKTDFPGLLGIGQYLLIDKISSRRNMARLKISVDDKYFKSDKIMHGRVVHKFFEELINIVFNKASLYWQAQLDMTKNGELPLLYNERNLYSIFASAIDDITPVHLSEWSFNKTDSNADKTRRVDFWCMNKRGENGKVINYFIELKKNKYCVSKGTEEKLTTTAEQSVEQINKQISDLKNIRPGWDGDGDVYLGIIVTHAYCSATKEQGYDETQVRDNIYELLDKRHQAQLLFSTWTLPSDIDVQWESDQCKFISIAGIAISKST
jgi:hypothetical protein